MDILWNVMMTVHAIVAVAIIFLVLLQHGKGADMGAAFGGGSSGSLFGATGSANFLSRTTAILAALFFATSLGMAYVATHKPRTSGGGGVMEGVALPKPATSAPAVPGAPAGAASGTPTAPSPAAIPGQDPAKAAAPAGAAPAQSSAPAPAGADGSKANQIPK